ncbi:hypothetical protein ACFO4O_03070 [Glaciecola siphonariae]|uniref:SGNH hydrolase-type esterase domain-containing protein n=1 Tax=Glaciecola siphonariae TaxID=521012 RepID=A0ABV9LS94_9ALTE
MSPKSSPRAMHSNYKRKAAFYVIAVMLPFIFFGLLEGALRLSGFGQSYPLFIPSAQISGYLQPNPDIIKRFFYPAAHAPDVAPDTYLFPKQKAPNTLRIVTLGGSTMAGFPYGRFGSPAGMLQQRINASHPNLNVEVISVAMSSINSFSLLDFTDEIVSIEPDAVLIYAGHNEYLGVMGVGSSYAGKGSYNANLLFLRFKEWRLYQLLQKIYASIFIESVTPNQEEQASSSARTLMASVAKEKNIAYNSALYNTGKEQFRQNLSLILNAFSSAKVPAFVSSIASNEKDQAPFNSLVDTEFDSAAANLNNLLGEVLGYDLGDVLENAYGSGQRANAPTQLINEYEPLIEQNKNRFHADFEYALALVMFLHKPVQARIHFENARDYDLLRFRAPSEFNQIIKSVSATHEARFVDSASALRQASEYGVIGNTLMLEHLHPNNRGYFEIAEAFYQSLLKAKLLPAPLHKISKTQALAWQPLSKIDLVFAQYKIMQLMSDYPFTDTPKNVSINDIDRSVLSNAEYRLLKERIEGGSFVDIQQKLIEVLQQEGRYLEAGIGAGVLFDALPNQHQVARISSLLLLRANALPLAQYYAQKAVTLNPRDTNYQLTLAEIIFKLGDINGAIERLNKVIAQDPANLRAKQILRAIKP